MIVKIDNIVVEFSNTKCITKMIALEKKTCLTRNLHMS